MQFLKKLFKKGTKTSQVTGLPIEIELIDNKLWVEVAIHKIPQSSGNSSLNALSFVTRGMEGQGQRELFFVLKTNQIDIEDIPQEALFFLRQIYSLTKQGQIAKEGYTTEFGELDLWGWKGAVYARTPSHLQKYLPANCLTVILLNLEEVKAVQNWGQTRVLSMLGKQARYYPYPYWTDHHRENLLIKEVRSKTALEKVRRMVLLNATIVLKNKKNIYFNINKEDNLDLREEPFPENTPIAILTNWLPEADSCLTWSFEQDKSEAITLPNSEGLQMAACMLVVIGQQQESSCRILEDGFALLLDSNHWKGFWQAMKEETTWELKTKDMNFAINYEN